MRAELRREGANLLFEIFQAEPTYHMANRVLEASPPEGRTQYARQMLSRLPGEPDLSFGLDLYLAAGDVAAAVHLLDHSPLRTPEQMARVATILATTDLDGAVQLWWKAALQLIANQHRDAYASAARYLADLRGALMAADRHRDWIHSRTELLSRYPRHRALHDEMQKNGAW